MVPPAGECCSQKWLNSGCIRTEGTGDMGDGVGGMSGRKNKREGAVCL